MIPILFSPTTTNFSTNGIGRLSDAISCTVHEVRNGEFELEMQYPITGKHFDSIVHSAIIGAVPSARRTLQAFRIYKISKPLNGRITINAQHISYQLSYIPVSPFSAASLADTLSGFVSNAAESCPFTLTADFANASSYVVTLPASIRSHLGGSDASILNVYGGEWEWNNYNCILHASRGQDAGYVIEYGKNLIDLQQEESIAETYTGLFPYWQSDETMVVLPEKVVHASTAANFPFQRTIIQDFSSDFDNAPTADALRAKANAYMTENNIGIPSVNLSIGFVNLPDSEEFKSLLSVSNIDLCDTVTVRFSKLGIDIQSQVIEIVWDVLKERYESIQIGDKKSSLASSIEEQMEIITTLATTSEVERTVDRATGVLNAGTRGHVVINRNADGYANEILILDNATIASAQKVLRINNSGIGFSSSGYAGPYYQAWTLDGHLSLGGVNNSYGHLSILDNSGNEIGSWSKDGIVITLGDIDIKKGASIGLYITDQVARLGDFEVNEQYGRQVLESSDEMTGMSGEPNQSGGLFLWAGYNSDNDYVFVVNASDAYVMYGAQAYPIGQTLDDHEDRIQTLEGGGTSGVTDTIIAGGVHWEFEDGLLIDYYET